ncbi:helix-turn-helix domain-containing protein [Streptomyces bohaiensis]|uniref:Helix-turn-helix domain-containing protein n=1 Tax=Streptomyces bohaiensis TaxID=1431344 RepID=A0ABX1CAH2_9ACTN|nr:helix-turn-helix transcriptional regulator [Streptomyces bohaiensis]NJQ14154.1 helix-turn-helix domain-containing protein [Streptomyces bohaiensis]
MPARARDLNPDLSARHLFGAELRMLREQRGYTLESLASSLKRSKSAISRYETAESMIPPDLPGALDVLLEANGLFTKLYRLARKEIHPDQFRRRMELEDRAVHFGEYTGQIVSGLVQTPAYAEAQFRAADPCAEDSRIADLVTARMTRQLRWAPHGPGRLALLLDEAVIRRQVGSRAVMREQLSILCELALTPRTTIQVLPFSHGVHALMGGTLTLLVLEDGTRVAYEESISTGTLVEDNEGVLMRQWHYDLLRASALSPEQSRGMMREAMRSFE